MKKLRRGRRDEIASKTIADDIRRQCLRGEWEPGKRVPLRNDLILKYGASATTVQQAVDQLVADGLLDVRGPAGTFVANPPPYLTNIALVFPSRRNDFNWRYFYDSLASAAAFQQRELHKKIIIYCCPTDSAVTDDLERLRDDMLNLRLGGLIYSITGVQQDLMKWRSKFDTPLVAIGLKHRLPLDQSVVALSYDSFFSRAIEFLAQRGRRRIALILHPGLYFQMEEGFIDREAARHGVEIRTMWRQLVGAGTPVCARGITHLLMNGPPADRPDGLIVSDDNMAGHALLGIQDSGIRLGADVDVILHTNLPSASPIAYSGVIQLGFDAKTILNAGVNLIETWRTKGAPPESVCVPAVFAHELLGEMKQDTVGNEQADRMSYQEAAAAGPA